MVLGEAPFYTIQGEGMSVGVPSVFIRFAGCNLHCGLNGLLEAGEASWKCDSAAQWKNGVEYTNEQLEQKIIEFGCLKQVLEGYVHLVWTGGEPALPRASKEIVSFVKYMENKYPDSFIFNEIETNGTVKFSKELNEVINQINCSPKLANSGMSESMRIVPAALNNIKLHTNHWWKFVVSSETDIKEIEKSFIIPYKLNFNRIILMPAASNRVELQDVSLNMVEWCKKYGYRMCSRLQVILWDKLTGV